MYTVNTWVYWRFNQATVLLEYGQLPPSLQCHTKLLCFYYRLHNIDSKYVVQVIFEFDELQNLHEMGFNK